MAKEDRCANLPNVWPHLQLTLPRRQLRSTVGFWWLLCRQKTDLTYFAGKRVSPLQRIAHEGMLQSVPPISGLSRFAPGQASSWLQVAHNQDWLIWKRVKCQEWQRGARQGRWTIQHARNLPQSDLLLQVRALYGPKAHQATIWHGGCAGQGSASWYRRHIYICWLALGWGVKVRCRPYLCVRVGFLAQWPVDVPRANKITTQAIISF